MKDYCKNKADLGKIKFTLWSLLWGQCTEIVKKKLKSLLKFVQKEKAKDCAWLLINLRKICSKIDDNKHPFFTLCETRKNLILCRQEEDQNIMEDADELQSVHKNLCLIDGLFVPLQENNKEKILKLHQQLHEEELTITLSDTKMKAINEWSDDQML